MQGKQYVHSHADIKTGTAWLNTKLISQFLTLSFLIIQSVNQFLIRKCVLIAGIYVFSLNVSSAPTGGDIVGNGSGSISQDKLTINQQSQNLAIGWDSFNIAKDEIFNVKQLNSSFVLLNRVRFNSAVKAKSIIDGQINAKGSVIIVNPNGVFFSATASVNVGGIIASSLDIAPSDFMNGNYIFNEVIGVDGGIV